MARGDLTADKLALTIQQFFAESSDGAVFEGAARIFDFHSTQYSISTEHGKCVLHIWSHERNIVRRVLDCQLNNSVLTLTVQQFGKMKPHKLEICRAADQRTSSTRRTQRSAYERDLARLLERETPGWRVGDLTSAMDLGRSFGPGYARGVLRRGQSALAVVGVNPHEPQTITDGALTVALLWLHHLREREAARAVVEGIKLFVPAGASDTIRARIAHLNHAIAKFELYEFDGKLDAVTQIDCTDAGNIATRLVRCPDEARTRERFSAAIAEVRSLVPDCQAAVSSLGEIAFRLYGLEFARARVAVSPSSFRAGEEVVFGLRGCEIVLTGETQSMLVNLTKQIRAARGGSGNPNDPLWRMQPERWLEEIITRDVAVIHSRLNPAFHYSQVPAFSASDRAMIDVLTCTHDGRLAVLELKADEDLHLPLQGLDYWARVSWHHARGEFAQFGYFGGQAGAPGVQLSPERPLLYLVAPALRIHPATETLLRYFSPDVEWELAGVDERWREQLKVVFRKRRAATARA